MQLELTRPTALLTRRRLARQVIDVAPPVARDEPVADDEPESFDDLTIPDAIAALPLELAFDDQITRECERALARTRRRRRGGRRAELDGTRVDTPRARRGRGVMARLIARVRTALRRPALQSIDHSQT